MTQDKKIQYMKIAAGICNFGFKHEDLDMLVSLYEVVIKKEGKTAIDDIVHVQFEVKARTEERALEEAKKKDEKKEN